MSYTLTEIQPFTAYSLDELTRLLSEAAREFSYVAFADPEVINFEKMEKSELPPGAPHILLFPAFELDPPIRVFKLEKS